ncbi:MAG TPA: B12-binding domain-containing radical SAM protein [Desulfobulbaceae bacterium]|nr:B12-binding domain-containing radical SAM protein [Desulfobulbaceae bacterium]
MNILLVYPEYPDTFWSFKHALRFVAKKAAFPPLGLLTVAALLPVQWQKKLVDMNVEGLTDDHLAWADYVFLGAMLVQSDSAREVIARCRQHRKKIVAGGPLFTTQHQNYPEIDHFVLNEAESTLPRFLDDLAMGQARPLYTSADRPDLARTPVPLWSLINMKQYATMPVQYSRGCPFNCEFCDIVIMNGRRPRAKSAAQMVREFQALYDTGWRKSVFIVDDNFIGNTRTVKQILPILASWQKEHRYPFTLLTEASINLAEDEELMTLMSKANFFKVFIGIESPNQESLRECDKQQNTASNLAEAVNTIHRYGMQVMGGFIVGFDHDPENIFDMQRKFIQQVGIVTAMVGLLTALPQTRLWHRLQAEGRLLNDATGENTDGFLNFRPVMDRQRLLEGYRRLVDNLYSQKNYYQRINTFLKHYRPTVKARVSREDLLALCRSIWQLGIKSRVRFRYWKLLAKTLLLKRKAMPMAVELAIYGLHFEQVLLRLAHNQGCGKENS